MKKMNKIWKKPNNYFVQNDIFFIFKIWCILIPYTVNILNYFIVNEHLTSECIKHSLYIQRNYND